MQPRARHHRRARIAMSNTIAVMRVKQLDRMKQLRSDNLKMAARDAMSIWSRGFPPSIAFSFDCSRGPPAPRLQLYLQFNWDVCVGWLSCWSWLGDEDDFGRMAVDNKSAFLFIFGNHTCKFRRSSAYMFWQSRAASQLIAASYIGR
jgi:hypothetical protein